MTRKRSDKPKEASGKEVPVKLGKWYPKPDEFMKVYEGNRKVYDRLIDLD